MLYRSQHPADGRWQRGHVVEAWYLGDSPETVWAEWYRAAAELGLPPQQLLPRDLWNWEISLVRVADLSSAERLSRVGLAGPIPGIGTWAPYQGVGEQLRSAGFQGLVAPSAARPQSLILCVFREAIEVAGLRPLPPPTTFDEPPVVPTGMTT